MNYKKIAKLQEELSHKVITKNQLPSKIKTICGVDVSYKDNKAYCSAVILDMNSLEIIESKNYFQTISSPYIPGLFMIREAKPILSILKKLYNDFDILFIDGHGRLHPRQCGLACYIGLKINKPVIGVAKKLLCGKIHFNSKIEYDGKILGYQIINNKKKIYLSTGHKINLRTAKKITQEAILDKHWYPEPLRIADQKSKNFRKSLIR